jgi:hypothetical protein
MRTGKERLGGKSTDEQRVDNCKVPLELRGLKPRPDRCVDDASTTSRRCQKRPPIFIGKAGTRGEGRRREASRQRLLDRPPSRMMATESHCLVLLAIGTMCKSEHRVQ